MNKGKILVIISIAFLIGGIVRLFANVNTFGLFRMEHLWSGEPFFVYIYKLLGVFVIWVGMILLICSRDIVRYRGVIIASMLGLALFFVVSLSTGFFTGLGVQFFLVDSIFALFLIFVLFVLQKA